MRCKGPSCVSPPVCRIFLEWPEWTETGCETPWSLGSTVSHASTLCLVFYGNGAWRVPFWRADENTACPGALAPHLHQEPTAWGVWAA